MEARQARFYVILSGGPVLEPKTPYPLERKNQKTGDRTLDGRLPFQVISEEQPIIQ